MNVYFILKGKNNPTKIICRFKPSQIYDFTVTTIYTVNREDWNLKQQKVKLKAKTTNKDLINSSLMELERLILDKWLLDTINKENILKTWLKNVVNNYFGKVVATELHKVYFVNWVDIFIEDAPKRLYKGKPISYKTIQQYVVTLKKIRGFEKVNDLKHRFENIDLKFYRNFVNY